VIVLDAYALVAYLRGEPAADDVAEILRGTSVLSAANAAEVIDQLVRVHSRDADDVHADLAVLAHAGMRIAEVTSEIGITAGRLRAHHYHRTAMAVSLAACIAAATALAMDQPLATADPDLAAMLRAEGGQVWGLVDSSGRLP
jgi:PIN domain nuclease of toxin-antitoxin system